MHRQSYNAQTEPQSSDGCQCRSQSPDIHANFLAEHVQEVLHESKVFGSVAMKKNKTKNTHDIIQPKIDFKI